MPSIITIKLCGHRAHVGTCPTCQKAQLSRWSAQLASVTPRPSMGVETEQMLGAGKIGCVR